MSTNAQLLDRMALRLGSRTNVAIRTNLVSEVNAAIELLEQGSFLPWFLEEHSTTLATVADQDTITLPTGFLREIEEEKPWVILAANDNDRVILKKRDSGFIVQRNHPDITNSPQVYAVRNTDILIGPIADQVYSISFPYYKASNDPMVDDTNAATNPWLINAADWVLNLGASVVADLHLQNTKLATRLQGYAGATRGEVLKTHTARQMQNWDDDADKFAGEG